MKRLLILLLVLAPGILPDPAAGVAVSNIRFDPGTEAAVHWGNSVYVYYDINVDLPEGARIVAIPYSQGAISPHYIYAGARFHDQGSDSGALYFTISSGDVLVDEVCFRVARGETSWPQILEFFVPVQYHFGAHAITDVQPDPASPSCVMRGQHVDISFSYHNDSAGDVYIYARPFTNGALTPGYTAAGSPRYAPGSGTGTHWFTITGSSDVAVDHIRFQMKSVATGEVLLEFFVPCSFDFRAGSVCDIGFDPGWPHGLLHDERVNVSFEYNTSEPGGVRVFILPYTNGSPTPGYAVSGSTLYPVGTGTGAAYFRITTGERTVDHVRFKMTNADQSVILFEYSVPVNYHYAADVVRQLLPEHPSPAYFTLGHRAKMELPYEVDEPGGIQLWAMPMTDGDFTQHGWYSPSFGLPSGIGSADRYVYATDTPTVIDQVYLLMTNVEATETLMTWYIDVALHYGDQPTVADAGPMAGGAGRTALFTTFANPLASGDVVRWELPRDADIRLRLFDVLGRDRGLLVQEWQVAGIHTVAIDPERHRLARGVYFLRLDARGQDGRETLRDQRKVIIMR